MPVFSYLCGKDMFIVVCQWYLDQYQKNPRTYINQETTIYKTKPILSYGLTKEFKSDLKAAEANVNRLLYMSFFLMMHVSK